MKFDHNNNLILILLKNSLYVSDLKSLTARVMRFSSQKAIVTSDSELVVSSEESMQPEDRYQFVLWKDAQVSIFTWNLKVKNSIAESNSIVSEHPIVHVGLYPVVSGHRGTPVRHHEELLPPDRQFQRFRHQSQHPFPTLQHLHGIHGRHVHRAGGRRQGHGADGNPEPAVARQTRGQQLRPLPAAHRSDPGREGPGQENGRLHDGDIQRRLLHSVELEQAPHRSAHPLPQHRVR